MSQRGGQVSNAPNMVPRGTNYPVAVGGSSPSVAAVMPNGTSQATPMNHSRPVPAIPRMSNGTQGINSVPSNSHGLPHAPMQPLMQIPQRVPAPMAADNRVFQEVHRVQDQQQRYIAAQNQHQHPQSGNQMGNSTSPNMNRVNAVPHHNTSLFGGIQGRSGSPSVNGGAVPSGSSTSPRMANPNQPQPLSNGTVPVINQIQNQVKRTHPDASLEQINAMTTDHLTHYRISHPTQAQAAAIHAAAGTPNAAAIAHNGNLSGAKGASQAQQQATMNGRAVMNSQEYAQMMRSQQSSQQNRGSSILNHARTMSRSATPQTHPGHAPSQSPRPPQAQMAGVQ